MMIRSLDPHFIAVLLAAESSREIAYLLPDGDLVEQQRYLLDTQLAILVELMEGKHHGTNPLVDFIKYTEEVKKQVERLKEREL